MSRRVGFVLVLGLLLGGLLIWSFLREGGTGADLDLDRSPTGASEEPRLRAGTGAAVLFGRPREQRVGLGGVAGRIADVEEAKGIAGASVMLVGMGHGGEQVTRQAGADGGGRFLIQEIPAGDAYDLRIQSDGFPARLVPGLAVRGGVVTDVGDLWLGARTVFGGVVVDAAGTGIVGARVQVHAGHLDWAELMGRLPELFAELDREPKPLAETRTSAGGGFRFDFVDPGPVTIAVRASGHAPGHLATVITPADEATPPIRIRLQEGATLRGRVVDGAGEPVAGARVAAVSGGDPSAFVFGRAFTHTRGDGTFWLDSISAGGGTQLLTVHARYPLTSTWTPAGTTEVRVVLRGGARLVVRVVDGSGGRAVEGATVLVSVAEAAEAGRTAPEAVGTGVTDPAGRVEFAMHPGTIKAVMVRHPDHAPGFWTSQDMGALVLPGRMTGPTDGALGRGRREIELAFAEAVRVEGVVTDRASGAPVPEARVFVTDGFQSGHSVRTDAEGRYALSAARGGDASHLLVSAAGYAAGSAAWRVDWGQAVDGLLTHDMALERGAVVTGRVVDGKGAPVAGARIRTQAQGEHDDLFFVPGSWAFSSAVSGRNGSFVMDGVPRSERVLLVARRTGYVDGRSKAFSTEEGGTVPGRSIVLEGGHVAVIEVVDPSGAPTPGAAVRVRYQRADGAAFDEVAFSPGYALSSDRDGVVRVEHVPRGTLTVTAKHPSWAEGEASASVGPEVASPLGVRVVLQAPRTIDGRILDPDGKPVARAGLSHYGGEFVTTIPVDEQGRFRLSKVPRDETITLHVTTAGFEQEEILVEPGREEIEIRLRTVDPDAVVPPEAVPEPVASEARAEVSSE